MCSFLMLINILIFCFNKHSATIIVQKKNSAPLKSVPVTCFCKAGGFCFVLFVFFPKCILKIEFSHSKLFYSSILTVSLFNLFRYSVAEIIMVSQSKGHENILCPITPFHIFYVAIMQLPRQVTAIFCLCLSFSL